MADSLRDQLLKAGLVTEEQVKAAETRPKGPRPQGKRGKAKPKGAKAKRAETGSAAARSESDLEAAYRARARQERAEREAAEQAKREAARLKKENQAKIKALIGQHTLNADNADIAYNFVVGGKVKQVYITQDQQAGLASGDIAITVLDGKRCLIPGTVAEQIHALDPSKLVVRHDPKAADEWGIPDDLMW